MSNALLAALSRKPSRTTSLRRARQRRGSRRTTQAEHLEARTLLAAFAWNTDADGNWNDAANWLDENGNSGIPGSGDDVTIDRGAANPVITVDSNANANSLTATERIVISGAKLFVRGDADVEDVDLSSNSPGVGELDVDGTATIRGTLKWDGGNIFTNLAVEAGAVLDINPGDDKQFGGTLVNAGTTVQDDTFYNPWRNTVFTNQSGAEWIASGDFNKVNGFAISFVNEGTFRKTGAATGGFGSTSDRFDHVAGSRVEVIDGTFALPNSGTGSNPSTGAAFHVESGATLNLIGPGVSHFIGTYSGSGEGRVEFSQGRLEVLDVAGGTGTTFDFDENLLHWTGGTIRTDAFGGDQFVNLGHMTWSGSADRQVWGQEFRNQGTVTHTDDGNVLFNSGGQGTWAHNDEGGLYENRGSGDLIGGRLYNDGTLRNVSGDAEFQTTLYALEGSVLDVTGDVARLTKGADIATSQFMVAAGAAIELDSTTRFYLQDGATLTGTGAGSVEFLSGVIESVNSGGTIDFAEGMFRWTGGDFFRDITSAGHLTISGDTAKKINNGFTNTGTVIHEAGAFVNASSTGFMNAEAALWEMQGDAAFGGASFVTGKFLNAGTLRKTGPGTARIQDGGVALGHLGGTVDVQDGDLIANSSNATGAQATGAHFIVAAGSTFEITNQLEGLGTFTGEGDGQVLINARIRGNGGTLVFDFPEGMTTLLLDDTAHSGIENAGDLTLAPVDGWHSFGHFRNDGTLTQSPGANVLMENWSFVRNYGLWELQDDAGIQMRTFDGLRAYFVNMGTIRKSGVGESAIIKGNGNNVPGGGTPDFSNTGIVEVEAGTLLIQHDALKQYNRGNQVLFGGTWIVRDSGALDFVDGQKVLTNHGHIILDGPGSSFPATDELHTVGGHFELQGGRDFDTFPGSTRDLRIGFDRVAADLTGVFRTGTGRLVGIAVDPSSGELVTHNRNEREDGVPIFRQYSADGERLSRNIPQPGEAINDSGIDIITQSLDVGGTTVPAGTLLMIHAQTQPATLYAIDRDTGDVLASVLLNDIPTGQNGVAHHPGRGTVFVSQNNGTIREIDALSGAVLNQFSVNSGGGFLSMTWGGLDVIGSTGEIAVVGSGGQYVRLVNPNGGFIRNIDLTYTGMRQHFNSDITHNDVTGETWITTENGNFYRFGPFRTGTQGEMSLGPGSELTVRGAYRQSGTANFVIGGSPASGEFGRLISHREPTLAGTANFQLADGFGPSEGDVYELMTFPSRTGDLQFGGNLDQLVPELTDTVLRVIARGGLADLAPTQIAVPAAGTASEDVRIDYTVRNMTGGSTLASSWTDSIYLSADKVLDATDPLIGRVMHDGVVGGNATYSESLTAELPGVLPGDYYVIAAADSRGDSPDADRSNNILASQASITVGIPVLTPDVVFDGNISEHEELYFRADLSTDLTPELLATLAVPGSAEIFVSQGAFPTRGAHDHYAFSPVDSALVITQPAGQTGTFYILVRGTAAAGDGVDFSLLATGTAFGLSRISNPRGSNTGEVSTLIRGAGFTPETQFALVNPTTGATAAKTTRFVNGQSVWVTFDLTGAELGVYDVRATDAGEVAELDDAFEVFVGREGRLVHRLSAPAYARNPFRNTELVIRYENLGDTDVIAPILQIEVERGVFRLPGQTSFTRGSAELIGLNPGGPADVLPPGARGVIRIPYIPDQRFPDPLNTSLNFTYNTVQVLGTPDVELDPGEPEIDWELLRDDMRPQSVNPDAWDAIYDRFKAAVGDTFDSYQRRMALNAGYLASIGQARYDMLSLITWELQKAANFGQIESNYYRGVLGNIPFPLLESRASILAGEEATLTFGTQIRGYYKTDNGWKPAGPNGTGTLNVDENDNVTLTEESGAVLHYRGSDGRLTRISNPRQGDMVIGFNGSGQADTIRYPNGDTETFRYNSDGRIDRYTDAVGRQHDFTYTAAGQIATTTDAFGTASFTYVEGQSPAADGSLKTTTYTDGTAVEHFWNDAGQLIGRDRIGTDGSRIPVTYEYDEQAAVTVTDADGHAATVARGLGGHVVRITNPLGQIIRYGTSGDGRVHSITDPAGGLSRIDYGDDFRIDALIDPAREVVSLDYVNVSGITRLGSITDPTGARTVYGYGSTGNLETLRYADGLTESSEFDSLGNVIAETTPAGTRFVNQFNSRDQMVRRKSPDGTSAVYAYDSRGNLVSASSRDAADNDLGTTEWTWDAADRMTSVSYPNGTSLTLTYDAAGRRQTATDHNGNVVRYTHDAFGRIAEVFGNTGSGETSIVSYTYNNYGLPLTETRGNGAVTTYEYDGLGRASRIEHRDDAGAVLEDFSYTYDSVGRITRRDALSGATHYEYDARSQLTKVTLPGGRVVSYAYDADGNRTAVDDDGTGTTWSAAEDGSDRYTDIGGLTPSYDGNGSLTDFGDRSYTYDVEGRLTEISEGTSVVTYEYDALGTRIAQIRDGVRTELLTDPQGLTWLFGEYTAGDETIYARGIGVAAGINSSATHYYHYDNIGNTALLTGAGASVTDTFDYLPFGEEVDRTGSTDARFRFHGQVGVAASGMSGDYLVRARNYSAELGRFLERDPLSHDSGETNLYRFVQNNPVTLQDPSGLIIDPATAVTIPGMGVLDLVMNPESVAAVTEALPWAEPAVTVTGANPPVPKTVRLKPPRIRGTPSSWQNTGRVISNGRYVGGSGVAIPVAITAVVGYFAGRGIDNAWEYIDPEGHDQFLETLNQLPIGAGPEDPDSPIFDNGGIKEHAFNGRIREEDGKREPGFVQKNMQDALTNSLTKRFIRDGLSPREALIKARRLVRNYRQEKRRKKTEVIAPSDPNNIVGPSGAANEPLTDPDVQRTRFEGYVRPEGSYPYEIHFENKPAATAPAQTVVVTHTLDEDLDLDTFELVSFGFGDTVIQIPEGRTNYYERVDVSSTLNVVVDFEATLDPATRELRVTYTSLDPVTFDFPVDPFAGFLTPNKNAPEGDGFVQFNVSPKTDLVDGTDINGVARIFFDFEAPIDTPLITNTIDSTAPVSSAGTLPTTVPSTKFSVTWSGSDAGAGIATYDVFVSTNGGPFQRWLTETEETSAEFTGADGQTYAFYSVATDGVGWQEAKSAAVESQTTVRVEASDNPCGASRPESGVHRIDDTLVIVGTNGNDTLRTREGSQTIRVHHNGTVSWWDREGLTSIVICGLRGRDMIDRDGHNTLPSYINGGRGPDSLHAGKGDDTVIGGGGDDQIHGNEGNDDLRGGSGNDSIEGEDGNDFLHGGSGSDELRGGNGNDTLIGSRGSDRLRGGRGNDILSGGNGRDLLEGQAGDDLLVGGKSTDRLEAGAGSDILFGGSLRKTTHHELANILDEWTSGKPIEQRLANLRGTDPSDDRLNGNAFLDADTLRDDEAADRLEGNRDADWFFSAAGDRLNDYKLEIDILDEL